MFRIFLLLTAVIFQIPQPSQAATFLVGLRSEREVNQALAEIRGQRTVEVASVLKAMKILVLHAADARQIERLKTKFVFVEAEIKSAAPEPIAAASKPSKQTQFLQEPELPFGLKMIDAPEAWRMTEGEGARVMVIDSGIDREHPALKDNFEKGYNFVEGEKTDDLSDLIGHGTHVAGIIAGAKSAGFSGVAPKAHLLMAKVCGHDSCSNTAVVQALGWALHERVDAVNLSLGGAFSVAEQFAINQLDSARIPVVAAAGNNGAEGIPFPAAYPSVTAVGAVDSTGARVPFSNWGKQLALMAPGLGIRSAIPRGTGRESHVMIDGEETASVTFGGVLAGGVEGNLTFAGSGRPEELGESTGKIVLVERGEIPILQKIRNAKAAGALAVVVITNEEILAGGNIGAAGTEAGLLAAMITKDAGVSLKQKLSGGLKTSVAIEIRATDFAELSGTSMASPFVAGVVALIRSQHSHLTSWRIRQILGATATPISDSASASAGVSGKNGNAQGDPLKVGRGLVNANRALIEAQKY